LAIYSRPRVLADQPPPPWLGAFFREALGYSRKLGERLLDLGCELGDPQMTEGALGQCP
jgi:hypothetical protein